MKNRNLLSITLLFIISMIFLSSCAKQIEPQETEDDTDALVKTIDLGDRQMDYFRFGNKDGEKLVILPGLALKSVMGSAEAVVAAYEIFAEDYDVYMFDHIKEEPEGYNIEQMAEDTLRAFDKLGLKHVNFMGVSLGGMIALVIGINDPEYIDRMILCSASADVVNSDRSAFEDWDRYARERNTTALMESFGEYIYSPEFYEMYKDIILSSGDRATELDYNNFIISNEAIMNFNVYDQLDKIKCPLFVIGADKDKVLGVKASYDIVDKLGCKYYIYENSYHGVYDEAPDYRERIKEFLQNN